jgi:hypothetical protein
VRLTEPEAAWLAGIIDGEGCFSARRMGPSGTNFGLQLFVASSDWRIVRRVKELFHKATGRTVSARRNLCSEDAWIVCLYKKSAFASLLPQILRFLEQKRPQAAFFYELACRRFSTHGVPVWAREYVEKIQWFNRHRMRPDGTWAPTGRERLRQSRGKPGTGPEPVETVQVTAIAEETVQCKS